MDKETAEIIIKKTFSDYNMIAEHFSKTRSFVWQEIQELKRFCGAGDKVLDLGCGNGRLLEILKDLEIDYSGVDNSRKLIELAEKNQGEKREGEKIKSKQFFLGDALNLPFKDNSFDKIFSLAVFHHIPSREWQKRFLEEAKRVLKPGGLIILTVWNLGQKRFWRFHLKYFFLKIIGQSKLDFRDILYPWKDEKGKILAERYLHWFFVKELINLAQAAGLVVVEAGVLKDKKNLYLVAKKSLPSNEKAERSETSPA